MEIGKQVSPVSFRLDNTSGVPSYLQIVRQVEDALRLAYLKPGDQLPRVKDVVAELAVNPNTVLKAYRDLEQKGLVVGRPGQGTFVEATVDVVPLADRSAFHQKLKRWMSDAVAAGLDEESITAIFNLVRHEVIQASREVAS
jgi:GntR family transcriptional regulator